MIDDSLLKDILGYIPYHCIPENGYLDYVWCPREQGWSRVPDAERRVGWVVKGKIHH